MAFEPGDMFLDPRSGEIVELVGRAAEAPRVWKNLRWNWPERAGTSRAYYEGWPLSERLLGARPYIKVVPPDDAE